MKSALRLYNLSAVVPFAKYVSMAMSMFSQNTLASNDDNSRTFKGDISDCQSSILGIIEDEIIPRLLKSERLVQNDIGKISITRANILEETIDSFAHLCIDEDTKLAQAFIDELLSNGYETDQIFLQLITPAARFLGTQWEEDLLDFTQVTHGLVSLHSISHHIGFAFRDGPLIQGDVKRIMISSAPGSEHLLGPTIVAEFFRKTGWQVVMEISPSVKGLVQAVGNEWFDTVGISVSLEQQLQDLGSLVKAIKKASRNPRLSVLLGGPVFLICDLKAEDFGADGICTDAKDAVALALSLHPKD